MSSSRAAPDRARAGREIPELARCLGNNRKEVITELDIGHTVHESEYSATKRGAVIGDGDVRWQEVLAACEKVGGA